MPIFRLVMVKKQNKIKYDSVFSTELFASKFDPVIDPLGIDSDLIETTVVTFQLVGCFGLNNPLRQYFSLYRAICQREGERNEKS